jgi:hypothetical protein
VVDGDGRRRRSWQAGLPQRGPLGNGSIPRLLYIIMQISVTAAVLLLLLLLHTTETPV